MKPTSLIVEYLITGLLFLIPMVELYVLIFHINRFDFDLFSTYKEVTIAIGTVLVYVLGAVFHRISNVVKLWSMRYSSALDGQPKGYAFLHQFGSDGVLEKITYFDSLLRLYRGVTLLSPVIGIMTWIWLYRMKMPGQGLFVFILCIILCIASFWAHRMQAIDRNIFIDKVFREIQEHDKIKKT